MGKHVVAVKKRDSCLLRAHTFAAGRTSKKNMTAEKLKFLILQKTREEYSTDTFYEYSSANYQASKFFLLFSIC
jgi:hypothetical protein